MYLYPTGAQPYDLLEQPTEYPVSLAEVKSWLKITNNASDAVINQLIAAVTLEVEKYTKRDLIIKRYRTYRDVFGDVLGTPSLRGYGMEAPITLRRSKLQVIEQITYFTDGVETVWNSANYRIVTKDAFSQVRPVSGQDYPTTDDIAQAVKIDFTAGYSATSTGIPADLKQAILIHIASLYYNRGDCDDGSGGSCSCSFAPAGALSVYNQYRIIDFLKA